MGKKITDSQKAELRGILQKAKDDGKDSAFIQSIADRYVERFGVDDTESEATKPTTKPIDSTQNITQTIDKGFGVDNIKPKVEEPPKVFAPKPTYSEEDNNQVLLNTYRASGLLPQNLSDADALKVISENKKKYNPEIVSKITEGARTLDIKRNEIANASADEILKKSAFKQQELLNADIQEKNVYNQSREAKVADIISRVKGGLQGEKSSEVISKDEVNYLINVAPKAYQSLIQEYNPTNSNNIYDVISNYNEKAKNERVANANARAEQIYKLLPSDWIDRNGGVTESTLLEKHKEFNDNYAKSISDLESQYPMQYRMQHTSDGEQPREIGRGAEYEAKLEELNNQRSQVNNVIAEANGLRFVQEKNKISGAKSNALKSPIEVGEQVFKLKDPDRYKVYVEGGKIDRGTTEEIQRLGINSLYASNDVNAAKLAFDDEKILNQNSLDLENDTYNRIGAEIYKQGSAAKYYSTYRRNIGELDEIVKQLPYPNRKMWYDKLRAIEQNQLMGTNIPMSGFMNKVGEGFATTAYETTKSLASLTNFRDNKDIANDALAGQDNKYSNVGETKKAQQVKAELEYKLKNKEQLSYQELQDYNNANELLGTKNTASKFLDGSGALVGQVLFQAVATRGLGGLATKSVGALGLLAEEAAYGASIEGNIANSIGQLGIKASTIESLSGAYLGYASSIDQAKQEAKLLMPDSETKQAIYANVVGLLNAATEHIFQDQKIFDPFKKELSGTILNIVNDLSTSRLSREALASTLKKALLASKEFGLAVVKNNQQEAVEEVATQIGTSLALSILAPSKFNNKEEFDKIISTYTQTTTDGLLLGAFSGGKEYYANRVGIPLLAQLGQSEDIHAKVIQGINAQVDNNTISAVEGNEKKYIANAIRDVYKTSMPKVDEISPNLKEEDRQKYAVILANEYVVKEKIKGESDSVIKSKLEEQLKESESKREAILDKKLTTGDNYELLTIEQANEKARLEAESKGNPQAQPTVQATPQTEEEKLQSLNTDGMQPSIQDNGQIVTTQPSGATTTTPTQTINGTGTYEFEGKLYIQGKDGIVTYENGNLPPTAEQEKVKKEGIFTPITPISNEQAQSPNIQAPSTEGTAVNGQGEVTAQPQEVSIPAGNTPKIETKPLIELPTSTKSDLAKLASDNKEVFGDFMPTPRADGSYSPVDFKRAKALVEKYNEETQISNNAITQQNTKQNGKSNQEAINAKAEGQGQNDVVGNKVGVASTNKGTSTTATRTIEQIDLEIETLDNSIDDNTTKDDLKTIFQQQKQLKAEKQQIVDTRNAEISKPFDEKITAFENEVSSLKKDIKDEGYEGKVLDNANAQIAKLNDQIKATKEEKVKALAQPIPTSKVNGNAQQTTTAKSKEKLPISSKVGEAVTVNIGGKAISGIVESDEGGKLTLSSGNKIIELSNDQQYVDYASPVRLADNQDGIEVNGEVYTEVRFDISNGKEVAVLIKEDGSITINSNPQIIEELKYQSALAMLDEMSEQEAQKLKQRYESKRTTEKPTKEGTNQTDGATQQKSEEEIKLQEAIDEIGLIEQIALDDLENNDKKARLIEHENGKTYLVEKNKDGSYTATLNGRKVRQGNHLNSLIEMYKTQSKKESDELIPKLQKQVDDLKQEVLDKLYNKQKTQEDATKESNKQQEVGTESNISQREGTVQGQREEGQGKGEQRSTENKGADNSNSNQSSEGQKEVKAESNPTLRDVESSEFGERKIKPKKVISTKDLKEGDNDFGNAAQVSDDGSIIVYHVTDNDNLVNSLTAGKNPKDTYNTDGTKREELGSGVYGSAVPEYWANRSANKYGFLKDLPKEKQKLLANKIKDSLNQYISKGYITPSEYEYGIKSVREYEKSGNENQLLSVSGQPYNIRFWENDYLKDLAIENNGIPNVVAIKAKGNFIEFSDAPYLTKSDVDKLIASGVDGAFVGGGFVNNPELVIFNKDAIQGYRVDKLKEIDFQNKNFKAVESLLSKEQTKSEAKPTESATKVESVKEAAKYEPEVIEEEQYEPITVGDTSHNSFTKDNSVDYEEDEKEGDNGRTYTYLSSITVELVDDFSGETIGRITKLKDEDGEITWRSEDIDGNEIDDNLSSKYEAQKSIVDKWNKEQEKEFKKEKAKAAKEKAKEAEKARKKLEKEAAKAAKATTASAEVVSAAQRVQQALEATGITVEVIDNDQDFQDKLDAEGVKRDGSDGASGVFISKSGKIFINASKVDDTWGSVDVWHEGTHPIINIIRNTNPNLYKSIIEGLNELVASNPEIAAVVDWAQSNYEGENTLEDETITETIARIANGNIDLSKIPTSLKDRIVDFINKIAKSLGIDPILKNSSIAEFKKIATEISEALREGKDISSIVGRENVKNFENLKNEDGSNFNQFKISNKFENLINGIKFEYISNSKEFDELIKSGRITNNKKLSDFHDVYAMLHIPDNAFTGLMYKDGELLVEGKGGVYFPIRFNKEGYFWASTEAGVDKLVDVLNKTRAANKDGKIRLALISSRPEKIMSSSNASNGMIDVLFSKAFDKRAKISESQVKKAILNASKEIQQAFQIDYDNKIKDLKNKVSEAKDKVEKDRAERSLKTAISKGVTEAPKFKLSESSNDYKSRLANFYNVDNSSFDERKLFNELTLKNIADLINEEDEKANKDSKNKERKIAQEILTFLGQGEESVKLKTTGGRLSKNNLIAGFSDLLGEPTLKGEKANNIYAILEVDSDVEKVEIGDVHGSYPFAVRGREGSKVVLHMLQDRNNWKDNILDPITNAPIGKSEIIDKKTNKPKTYEKRVTEILPTTAGITFAPIKISSKTESNPQFSKGNRGNIGKPINWEQSKEGKGDPSISSRNPIVQEAAKNLKEGKITNEEYRATVSENSPIGAITRFFEPATLKRVKESISVNVDKINSRIKEGTRVALRLDIPAYKNKNTWVVSVHDGNLTGGKIMSYTNVAKIKNVVFKTESTLGALNIATAKEKQTIARMFGDWEVIKGSTFEQRGENAKKMIEDIVNDPSYVQVGMNPFRHSYFYDRSSDIGRPIKSADEVIQVGGLVYAKNPIYGNWTDEAYRVKGLLDANQNPVQFSKGNRDAVTNNKTTPQQKKEVSKIIEFFNKQFGLDVFAPFSEFTSKLKSLGYDSLKAMVDSSTTLQTRNGKEIGYTSDTEQVARERFDFSKLKKIGQGSDRTVFELGDGKVLKVAHTARGLEQNIYEGDYYLSGIVPEVFERGLNYVVVEETPRLKSSDIVPTYDIETNEENGTATAGEMIKELSSFTQSDFDNKNSKLQDVLNKYGFQDILSYDVLYGDFNAMRNWGYKNGIPMHLDGGTFGGVRMITSHKGKAPLTDPEFREIYYKSKELKKEFGDTDRFTKFLKKPNGEVLGFVDKDGKVYLNPNALTPETTFHELTHVQQQLIKIAAEQGDEKAKAVLRRWDKLLADNDVMSQMGKWDKTDTTLQAGVRKNVAIGAISLMTLINSGNVITKNNIQNTSVSEQEKSNWDLRADGTKKGNGYFGVLKMKDGSGKVASEISIGIEMEGKEVEIPTLVPTLTKSEIEWLLEGNDPNDRSRIGEAIVKKAIKHAVERIKNKQSPFANEKITQFSATSNGNKQRVIKIKDGNKSYSIDLSSTVYSQGLNESDSDYAERIRNEVWSYLTAPENANKWNLANKSSKVSNFINAVVDYFKNKLGLKGLTNQQILNSTLKQLIENTSNSLMKGEWLDIKNESSTKNKNAEIAFSMKMPDGSTAQVQPINADVVNGFYSPLEKIINETKFEKLPAKQWVDKFAKGEEAKLTGLTDWLNQQQGSVSKADIQKYLKDNRISVVEVVKGAEKKQVKYKQLSDMPNAIYGYAERFIETGDKKFLNEIEKEGYTIHYDNNGEVDYFTKEDKTFVTDLTKFSQYQLEGEKENYKEILVTLPSKNPLQQKVLDLEKVYEQDGSNYNLRELEEAKRDLEKSKTPSFRSSHFDEPNILVHLRMNTRTDADGNKVLFLEEVQSDWGQKGKKEGFEEIEYPLILKRNGVEKIWDELANEYDEYPRYDVFLGKEQVDVIFTNDTVEKWKEKNKDKYYKKTGVVSAPFVTDTNAWTKLGLKVALKEAVKQGADKIAWSTGTQQFDRWGSEEIHWDTVMKPKGFEIVVKDDAKRPLVRGNRIKSLSSNDGSQDQQAEVKRLAEKWNLKSEDLEVIPSKGKWTLAINEQTDAQAFQGNEEALRSNKLEESGISVGTKVELRDAIKRNLSRERNDAEIDKLTDRIWNRMQTEDSGTSLPRKEGMEEFYGNPKDMERAKDFTVKKEGELFTVKDEKGKTIRTFKQENEANKFKENYGLGIVGNVAKSLTKQEPKTVEIKTLKPIPPNTSVADIYEAGGMEEFKKKNGISSIQHSIDVTPELKAQVEQGQPLFQISSEADQAEFFTNDKTPATKEKIQAKFKDAEVVQSESDLPKEVQDEIKAQKADGRIKGVYYNGRVILIADNIKVMGEAIGTYRHEMLGHKGVIERLGTKLNKFATDIVNNAKTVQLKKLEQLSQLYFGKPISELNAKEKSGLGQEYISFIAENRGKYPSTWQKIVDFVKQTLRSLGIPLNVSDKEIISLIGKVERTKNESKVENKDNIRFSIDRNDTDTPFTQQDIQDLEDVVADIESGNSTIEDYNDILDDKSLEYIKSKIESTEAKGNEVNEKIVTEISKMIGNGVMNIDGATKLLNTDAKYKKLTSSQKKAILEQVQKDIDNAPKTEDESKLLQNLLRIAGGSFENIADAVKYAENSNLPNATLERLKYNLLRAKERLLFGSNKKATQAEVAIFIDNAKKSFEAGKTFKEVSESYSINPKYSKEIDDKIKAIYEKDYKLSNERTFRLEQQAKKILAEIYSSLGKGKGISKTFGRLAASDYSDVANAIKDNSMYNKMSLEESNKLAQSIINEFLFDENGKIIDGNVNSIIAMADKFENSLKSIIYAHAIVAFKENGYDAQANNIARQLVDLSIRSGQAVVAFREVNKIIGSIADEDFQTEYQKRIYEKLAELDKKIEAENLFELENDELKQKTKELEQKLHEKTLKGATEKIMNLVKDLCKISKKKK